MSEQKRDSWGSKLGLILAMAGNAIGLGNFWRFPYQAAKYGGGAFMVPYFIALIFLGIPLMFVEWGLGKTGGMYGHGTLGPMVYLQAREKAKPRNALIFGMLAGALAFSVVVLVNSYYNQIIGWTLGYSWLSLTGGYKDAAKSTVDVFLDYIGSPVNMIFWIISLAALAFAVMRGIQKGIEAWAKVMMPLIYVFGFILIGRTLTLGTPVNPDWSPIKGLEFIWTPRWADLNWAAALAAAGQIFFTLSLGMGIIANYASYLKRDDDIVVSGFTTVALNEFAEVILGGTIAIPIAYTFLGKEGVGAGVGLSFIALPNIFRTMVGGQLFGAFWFLLLFFAGFTSSIAMFNYLTSLLEEDLKIDRKKGAWIVFGLYILVGLPVGIEPTLIRGSTAYLDSVDFWVGNIYLIVLGLIEVVVMGWLYRDKGLQLINRGSYWKLSKGFYRIFIQVLTPLIILVFLIGFITQQKFDALFSSPWATAGQIVVLAVLVIGLVMSYKSIKDKYGREISENRIIVVKE
ncbi:MAG: sodium-dependent transporter [Rectinemataceae bacterium]